MMQRYDNLRITACANTLKALLKKGVKPPIIASVSHDLPAVKHIVDHL